MTISLTIPNVSALDPGVWKAKLPPDDLRFLGGGATRLGPLSVLLILDSVSFDRASSTLSFSPANARVLNLGSTENALIVESRTSGEAHERPSTALPDLPAAGGDADFIAALPSSLRSFGAELLMLVRESYPGALRFFPKSGKYVESPDNFWTVRIQTRDQSFRVTVRGRPEDFLTVGDIQLSPDMTGYSSFKLSAPSQLTDFMKILQQVPKKGRRS
jgi:hypothetical protein